jgi:hypothetical protein
MKKGILLLLLIFFVETSYSQDFEGIIKWAVKIDLKNAQVQNAEKGSDGAQMDAEIKKLEEQLNDPQFKKQMEANPQLKSLMEENLNRLKSMQGNTGGAAGFMPTGLLVKIKNGNNLIKMEGGISEMMGEILYLKEKDQSYSIRRKNKTYSVLPKGEENTNKGKGPEVKVTKTSETLKILGYTCTKYIVQVTDQGKTIHQTIWTTKEIKNFDPNGLSKMTSAGSKEAKIYLEGVEGVPLKMEIDNGEMKMAMEVIELKNTPLDASLFVIPSDYKLVKGFGF